MKILIDGANGFLGKVLCKKFKSNLDFEILTLDKQGECDLKGDLSNKEFVDNLPDVDIYLHLASVQYVSPDLPFFFRKKYFYNNNVQAAQNLVKRYRGKLKYFLNVSTSMVYEQKKIDKYKISSPKKALGIYGITKLKALEIFKNINAEKQTTLYPSIILGEGREGLFRGFIERISKYSLLILPGNCDKKTAVVHVEDVADSIYNLVCNKIDGEFNLMAQDVYSIKEWVEIMENRLNKKAKIKIKIPLFLIKLLGRISFYRLLAREQILMLEYEHILDISENYNNDIPPKISAKKAINDICNYILKKGNN